MTNNTDCEIPQFIDRRPSVVDTTRTLYPLSFRSSTDSAQSSPSSSRRGSFTEPLLFHSSCSFRPSLLSSTNSPPSSPSSRRSSMATTPENFAQLPTPPLMNNWRRESLPSISYLTSHKRSASIMDDHQRRHSIATTKLQEEQEEQELDKKRRDSTPYSRSPELRISHKLAERKRRKEMKDLFDDLRDLIPLDKGLKSSKWEILSKALDYIRILQQREILMEREKADLINEIKALRR